MNRMQRLVALVLGILLSSSGVALAGGEAAFWTQMKRACRDSGGVPSSEYYNDWVERGGCVCNGTPSGQPTCSGSSSAGSGGSGASSRLGELSAEAIAKGLLSGNAGLATEGVFWAILNGALQGNSTPEDYGRIAAEEAERERLAEQQRQEELQRQEQIKERILGALKGTESSGELGLKTETQQSLMVTSTRSSFGSAAVVPVSPGMLSAGGLQLKLNDDAEQGSMSARQGFDTPGAMLGAGLSSPPVAPETYPVVKAEKITALKAALQKGVEEEKTLQAVQEKLAQLSRPDEPVFKDVQKLVAAKKDENKKLEKQLLDLTADDDEDTKDRLPLDTVAGRRE